MTFFGKINLRTSLPVVILQSNKPICIHLFEAFSSSDDDDDDCKLLCSMNDDLIFSSGMAFVLCFCCRPSRLVKSGKCQAVTGWLWWWARFFQNDGDTWMSRWKLGSMVSKWVIAWVVPPPSNSGKWRFIRIPCKRCNNPGGVMTYSYMRSIGVVTHLLTTD